jgi:transposase
MDVVHKKCSGLDVHRDSVAACVALSGEGRGGRKEIRIFGTTTRDLLAMSDWLAGHGVTHVAMESTGVFWKPVFNILESRFEVILVNARHIKQVPGRKTDVKDCEWIADLLRHGLLKASFVPDRPQRELRDLTRHRAQLVGEQTRVANRIHKILEDGNIKLGSVASDLLGKSGREMIQALLAGDRSPAEMADLARGRLRDKREALTAALEGRVTEHHKDMLRMLWDHLLYLEKTIEMLDNRIEEMTRPFESEIRRLDGIPGVDRVVAQAMIAEIGTDMSRFATAAHLASWAGLCPGNYESAGKRKSGRLLKGNRWLRRSLCQAAWGASHTKDTYMSAHYRRIAKRRGKKRAIVALGHTILVSAYYILLRAAEYKELGGDYFDRLNPARLRTYHVHRLEDLGYQVQLTQASLP